MKRPWLALIAPLVLGGCLLPQPDTPIIPPLGAAPPIGKTAPVAAPAPDERTVAPGAGQDAAGAMANGQPGLAPMQPASLSVSVGGATASGLQAVPVGGGEPVKGVEKAGGYALTLPPGSYWLELTLSAGVRRVDRELMVMSAEQRTIAIQVDAKGETATLSEEAPLVAATQAVTPTGR